MYGDFGKINASLKKRPSERAVVLRHIVDTYTVAVYNNGEILRTSLLEAKMEPVAVKQLELALTSPVVKDFLVSEEKDPTSMEINHVLFAIEGCGLSDADARELLDDLLYSKQIDPVLREYVAVKEAVGKGKATNYIPPQLYQEKLQEIMGYVSAKDEEKLTSEVQEELSTYAECHIGEANYILSLMYRDGIGVVKDMELANTYAQKAVAGGYPPAYAMLGDVAYSNNRFDEAYAYYTKPGAIALDEMRRGRVDTLRRAKGFANQICIALGVLYGAFVALMIGAGKMLSVSSGRVLPIFLALMTLAMVRVLWVHHKKPLQDLRYWGIAFVFLLTLYFVFAVR